MIGAKQISRWREPETAILLLGEYTFAGECAEQPVQGTLKDAALPRQVRYRSRAVPEKVRYAQIRGGADSLRDREAHDETAHFR